MDDKAHPSQDNSPGKLPEMIVLRIFNATDLQSVADISGNPSSLSGSFG